MLKSEIITKIAELTCKSEEELESLEKATVSALMLIMQALLKLKEEGDAIVVRGMP